MKSAAFRIVRAIPPLLLTATAVPAFAAGPLQPKLEALIEAGNSEAAYNLGMLYLIAARQIPEMKKDFESEARKALGEADYKQVVADVAAWREARTLLTQRADEGIGASYKAAGLPVPAN